MPLRRALLCLLACQATSALPLAALQQDPLAVRVHAWRAARQPEILRELMALLAIPNVTSDTAAIRRNAHHIVGMLEQRGIRARILEHPGASPAVFGELRTPGATRTVMLYAHYDGQAVVAERWQSPPFEPTLLDGPRERGGRPVEMSAGAEADEWRLYARSASDDKSPIVAMLSALDALRALGETPAVNLKFFFEGGEESGSSGLGGLLERHRELVAADLWLMADGPVHPTRRPQVVFGVRGVQTLAITLYGPARALHSGHYGNWAPNPAARLAELLASMRDGEGGIRIAGFSDDVRPLTAAEAAAVKAMPRTDDSLRAALAIGRTEAADALLAERITLPALNVQGLRGGDIGVNAVPVSATAGIDFRLVPDQQPARLRERVEAHVRAQGYTIVHAPPTPEQRGETARLAYLNWGAGPYAGYRAPLDLPLARAVVEVTRRAVGEPVVVPMLGGSLPISVIAEVVGVPIITLPIVNHDNNQHADDENLRLRNLWDGIALFAAVMVGLGER